ncbi:ErfK/YbiS/YcfS/YnhG protein [Sporomusaceae bacterium FL31]|nr:ErfK/YbiS/YcfS/YnhG protein [Sporomusaceae bacterium FL31]GCE35746.1 ErfK/YbiS/YcfS/YnhG protein [Sporomusaceae bacterium]
MRNKDVEELFEWVPIGTPVRIEGRKIRVQRVLKYQTAGADVVLIQMKLKELGYLNSRADGIYGNVTAEAVKAFQNDHGLEVTGVVDKVFVEKLGI